jgi:polysaccharide deacetylase family protein (PEP-CTERM system associated)
MPSTAINAEPGNLAETNIGSRSPAPRAQPPSLTHIMSVDVEDYFQVEAFADIISPDTWDSYPSRVVENTRRVLEILGRHETKGTFFFVGWVAERFPSLVREVLSHGHELACHSYLHQAVYKMAPEAFREDTRKACDVIEQAGGVKLAGYRAPSWSITGQSMWALDILAEQGFTYDSSIFPIRHDLYGVPGAQRFRYTHSCAGGLRLREFPPTTIVLGGMNFPAAGGGYLRIFPLSYTFFAMKYIEKKYGEPVVVYLHPWEIDTGQPRIHAGLKSRLRHYTNIGKMEGRLTALLRSRRFRSFRELMAAESQPGIVCGAENAPS